MTEWVSDDSCAFSWGLFFPSLGLLCPILVWVVFVLFCFILLYFIVLYFHAIS